MSTIERSKRRRGLRPAWSASDAGPPGCGCYDAQGREAIKVPLGHASVQPRP